MPRLADSIDMTQFSLSSRRGFFRSAVALVPAGTLAACDLKSSGTSTPDSNAAGSGRQPSGTVYQPYFFDAKEWAFIHAAVDRLIPADSEGPSGVEAGVPEFIDRQMETPYAHGALWFMQTPFTQGAPELGYQLKLVPRDLYRLGIEAVNAYCMKTYAHSFDALDATTRDTVLGALENAKIDLENVPAEVFFGQLLQNTREGYFCDPIHGGNRDMGGWKMIGFPGARADFMDFVNQKGQAYPYGPVSIEGKRT
jgi:gluconate 2-dehydrogenase gamma chain